MGGICSSYCGSLFIANGRRQIILGREVLPPDLSDRSEVVRRFSGHTFGQQTESLNEHRHVPLTRPSEID